MNSISALRFKYKQVPPEGNYTTDLTADTCGAEKQTLLRKFWTIAQVEHYKVVNKAKCTLNNKTLPERRALTTFFVMSAKEQACQMLLDGRATLQSTKPSCHVPAYCSTSSLRIAESSANSAPWSNIHKRRAHPNQAIQAQRGGHRKIKKYRSDHQPSSTETEIDWMHLCYRPQKRDGHN